MSRTPGKLIYTLIGGFMAACVTVALTLACAALAVVGWKLLERALAL